ncbi:molecular chaperone HtpG [Clostridia bacterium]|nr:molecular chaperone HtpG [Clostridia bacterium]
MSETGNLSINSENILPIIKKWLYSDTDIFVRELVSNAADAITKLRKLNDMGETTLPEDNKFKIDVALDPEEKTITFSDNGIGMTADEVKQYINEIAFSGANDFVEKYKDKIDKEGGIIGHFGLGFYSAFMAADKVTIDTLSYKEGSQSAHWECTGGIEYSMTEGNKTERGTTITLHIGEDAKEFLETYKLRQTLHKYCGFIPVEIYFETAKTAEEKEAEEHHVHDENCHHEEHAPVPINDTAPLWTKQPSECTDEEYKEFYRKVFADYNEPLFWIHLNMDYPFNLQGILYFPKLKHELESIEGQVKLYSNQVFIADNIKEVIPEFLLLLKGALDCKDLPLNVSRSFLQNDGYVTKMSSYITKKVADKLNSLYKKDREQYSAYWDDISPFIKYGAIKDKDFYDKVKDAVLYKTINGKYVTLPEYLEAAKEKHENQVYYVSNEKQQAQYIKLFKDFDMDAVILSTNLDNPFMSYVESYGGDIKFNRIDSDISSNMKNEPSEPAEGDETDKTLEELFKTNLGNDKLQIKVESLKSEEIPAIVLLSEQSRRMQEMSKMFGSIPGMPFGGGNDETLVLNKSNKLIQTLLRLKDDESRKEDTTLICEHIHDLAYMSHEPLDVAAMNKFVERSNKILERIAN